MVDFRYHIVSIVAIFLALAIGIVLGAGPLKTTSDAGLRTQVNDLRTNTKSLQGSLASSQAQVQFLDSFGAEAAPALLADRLVGLDVALVSLPGANPSLAAGLVTALKQANATVSVQASISSSWTDPGQQGALAAALESGRSTPSASPSLAPESAAPESPGPSRSPGTSGSPTSSGSPLPSASATVYSDVAAELAGSLLTSATPAAPARTAPATSTAPVPTVSTHVLPVPSSSADHTANSRPRTSTGTGSGPVAAEPIAPAVTAARTLAALVAAGFVTLSSAVPTHHPTLAVVLAGDPAATADDTSTAATAELATLAEALRAGSDGTVVAGTGASAEAGGLVALIRASRPTAGELSTVDSVDTVVGRIAVPLALAQQQSHGEVGQYGSVGQTNGPLPPVDGIGPG